MAQKSNRPSKMDLVQHIGSPLHDEEHINLLEVRASHLMMRWRSRTPARIKSRCVHLVDSPVALAFLCKGRSSSWKMNSLLRRIGALTVAGGFLPSWGYTMSLWNPADKGSRRFERGQHRRGAQPRRSRPKKSVKKRMLKKARELLKRNN